MMNKLTIAAILAAMMTGCATAPTPASKTSIDAENCSKIYWTLDRVASKVDPMIASCALEGVRCPTQPDLERLHIMARAATVCLRAGYIPPGDIEQRQQREQRRVTNMKRIVARLEGRS